MANRVPPVCAYERRGGDGGRGEPMLIREAIEAYVLQLLQGVATGSGHEQLGVAFQTDKGGILFMQRNGQHFRVIVEEIELLPS